MKELKELFVHGLRDMYCLEKKLLTELKEVKDENKKLNEAFLKHANETRVQIDRLKMVGVPSQNEKCDLKGILDEENDFVEKYQNDNLLDAIMNKAGINMSIVK